MSAAAKVHGRDSRAARPVSLVRVCAWPRCSPRRAAVETVAKFVRVPVSHGICRRCAEEMRAQPPAGESAAR